MDSLLSIPDDAFNAILIAKGFERLEKFCTEANPQNQFSLYYILGQYHLAILGPEQEIYVNSNYNLRYLLERTLTEYINPKEKK